MRKIALLHLSLTLLLFATAVSGCGASQRTMTLDEKVLDIYKSLMCPICAGETIDQSQSDLAKQMKALVREKVEQGATKEEILQFFKERYGEKVLAAPTKAGFNLFLWVVPSLALVVGGYFLYRLIKNMQKRAAISEAPATSIPDTDKQYWEDRLKAELDDRDRKAP